MKMTDELFQAIMRNIHAYVLLIKRDLTVFYTNYYDHIITLEILIVNYLIHDL